MDGEAHSDGDGRIYETVRRQRTTNMSQLYYELEKKMISRYNMETVKNLNNTLINGDIDIQKLLETKATKTDPEERCEFTAGSPQSNISSIDSAFQRLASTLQEGFLPKPELLPFDFRSGTGKQPYAIRSRLGWAIRGPIRNISTSNVINAHFEESRYVLLQRQLERMWTTEFNDNKSNDKNVMSVEDKQALKIMKSSIIHEDGHYKLGLSWRDKNTSLTNNMVMAQACFQQLKRKLECDDTLYY
ncbi:unnamed protein product [Mytilus coruscus]|uniref:Uncharacterized protein n=1 Tax=Mytilus coruscus TaxID=42192 RepID=A0A6J8BW70_MYTCO|nr:unnamed protein product [Mytilus coruscus]